MLTLTELEKTILLASLVLTKGSTRRLIDEQAVVLKFPVRQRKKVSRYMKKLVRKGFLTKKDETYSLTKEGLKRASSLLIEGAKLWKYY